MTEYKDFIKDWNYSKPSDSRKMFLIHLQKAQQHNDKQLELEIQTQIARTFGLELQFEEAHTLLNDVERQVSKDQNPRVAIRYNLERGRVYNSNKQPEKAINYFLTAQKLAEQYKEDFLNVDALHMIAIAEKDPIKQIQWNEQAIQVAMASNDKETQEWQGSLLNNTGWSLHDMKEYEKALDMFNKALDYRKKQGKPENIAIAMWCVARTYRSINDLDNALKLQLQITKYRQEHNLEEGGYNFEELGEIYLVKGKRELATKNFIKAYELLSKDPWLVKNEQKRLERIKTLTK